MDICTFNRLKNHFNSEKQFIIDGYYRLRECGNAQYELAYLEAGPCGDTTIHPQITLEIQNEQVIPVKLLDMAVSPVLRLTNELHQKELDLALEKLTQRFLHVLTVKETTEG